MEFTYRQLEATLRGHFRISPDRAPTFTSRIKQLQRLNFPGGVNIGRGVKMTYTGEHLFKLLTAFELISLGLPAQTVAGLVEKHWRELSGAYALAILTRRDWGESRGVRIYVRFALQSMHELQFGHGLNPAPSRVTVMDHESLMANFSESDTRTDHCVPVLLVTDIVSRLQKVASESAGVSGMIYDEEPNDWLPKGDANFVLFHGRYPDRSNLKMRRLLHHYYENDPESLTPEGAEEANEFIKDKFGAGLPF